MINVEYEGKQYPIRNTMKEITIEEMEMITYELSGDVKILDAWFNILESLSVDTNVIENIDIETFSELIKSFDFKTKSPIQKTIIIDGVEYHCYEGDSFKLKMKTLNKILDIITYSEHFYIARIAALLYKRDDYSELENNDPSHLKYKEEFFKTQPADIIMDVISQVNDKVMKKLITTGGI